MKKITFILSLVIVVVFSSVSFSGLSVSAAGSFKDLDPKTSSYEIIHKMRDLNLITGYEDGTFRPNNQITRQHAAALIYRAVENDYIRLTPVRQTIKFNDLSTTHRNYNQMLLLYAVGALSVDSKGNIYPDQKLTRGEMAHILVKAFNLPLKQVSDFKDMTVYSPYIEAVRSLYGNDITTGYPDLTFRPNEPLTRAHYAVFMDRAMNIKQSHQAPKLAQQGHVKSPEQLIEDVTYKIVGKAMTTLPDTSKYPTVSMFDYLKFTKTQRLIYDANRDQYWGKLGIDYDEVFYSKLSTTDKRKYRGEVEKTIIRLFYEYEKQIALSKELGMTIEQVNQMLWYGYATGNVIKLEEMIIIVMPTAISIYR